MARSAFTQNALQRAETLRPVDGEIPTCDEAYNGLEAFQQVTALAPT